MTENFDRFPNQSKPPAATTQNKDVNNSTNFKIKNFTTIPETNITRDELKSVQKSIAKQQQTLNKILNLLESLRATTKLLVVGGI